MSYNGFAWWYDCLNTDAEYQLLSDKLVGILEGYNIQDGIVADLGCGTGAVSVFLAQKGYDIISIDKSPDMLGVFRSKLELEENRIIKNNILLLCQDLAELDLYGTIKAAVSTFDTVNHLPPQILAEAIRRICLFMEPGGVFIFDANSPYKHSDILADNTFLIEAPGIKCYWHNNYNMDTKEVTIELEGFSQDNDEPLFYEEFIEYTYTEEALRQMLTEAGFIVESIIDGETFSCLTNKSSRYLVTAVKPSKE